MSENKIYSASFVKLLPKRGFAIAFFLVIYLGFMGQLTTGNNFSILFAVIIYALFAPVFLVAFKATQKVERAAEVWSDRVEIRIGDVNSRLEASQIESATVTRMRSKSKNIGDVLVRGTGGTKFLVSSVSEPLVFAEHLRQVASKATSKNVAEPASTNGHRDLAEQLMSLNNLYDAGALNEEQFEAAKAKILGS